MDVVVIGAVAAGMSAASKAKRTRPGARVRVFGMEQHVSYAACGLPYYIGDVVQDQAQLIARTRDEFARQGIEVNVGYQVKKILPGERQLLVLDTNDQEQTVSYDKLVICTGARPVLPPIGNSDLANVFTVSSIPDSEAIRSAIAAGAKRAVIVGGGYIGLEMVEALRLQGMEVSLIERSEHIAGTIDPEMAEIVRDYLLAEGVDVQTGVVVEEFIGEETVRGVCTNQGTVSCDLAIVAVGVRPNSELAREAGIELGVRDAIRVNRRMETNLPDIYAAGDCAVAWHELYQDDAYIPLGTTANKQGRIAGENVVGGQAEFAGIVGTGIMKVMDLGIGRTGLSSREAETLGKDLLSVQVDVNNRASYYPQAGKGTVKLLFDHDGKVWGAQMVGSDSFAKRIDVFAAAIQSGCSLQQLAGLDLSYSPPFSPVWDPVLVATNVAMGKLR